MRLVLALAAAALAACGGAVSAPGGPRDVPFTEHGATGNSGHGAPVPRLIVALTAPSRAELGRLVPMTPSDDDRVPIAAFEGQQRTGGYTIRVTRISRDGNRLTVQATFGVPPSGAITTQVLLAELRFAATAFPAAVAGLLTANAIATEVDAKATSTATWFRALKSDGTTVLMDGSVGIAAADLILDSVAIQLHADVQVTSFTLQVSRG